MAGTKGELVQATPAKRQQLTEPHEELDRRRRAVQEQDANCRLIASELSGLQKKLQSVTGKLEPVFDTRWNG